MPLAKTIACLALSCVSFLACGGTFCEAYPEACGAVGGGGGAGGGGSQGPFDVEVSLLDASGNALPLSLLVSDLEGAEVAVQRVDLAGKATITLPGAGYYINVFHTGDDTRVFTAMAVPEGPKLSFQLPPPPSSNPPADIEVDATCSSICMAISELSLPCREPVALSAMASTVTGNISNYAGCASSATYDAYLVGYALNGDAYFASSASADLPGVPSFPTMTPVQLDERFDFFMEVEDNQEIVTRAVRAPYADRPGYGFSHAITNAESTVRFSLLTAFVPRAQATFEFAYENLRSVWHQQLFDTPEEGTTASFVPSSIAVPKTPPAIGEDDPTASYELGGGPQGDAIQLKVRSGTVTWIVNLPAAPSGSFRFPNLPEELAEAYGLGAVLELDVLHLNLDASDGFGAFSEQILDYATDTGLADLTIGRSRRLF